MFGAHMKLCLNMIVKNESGRIERALRSAAPFITSWVIIDTGSTDDTKQKIVDFFQAHGIPGEIRDAPFIDWAQARNAALDWARKLSFAYEPDYILLMDADMELRVRDEVQFLGNKEGLSYEMYQQAGSVVYTNARLVSVAAKGYYRGVTHEFLDIPTAGCIDRSVADFYDHADGANRPEKFKRDIRLLKAGLKAEPNNERYMFYLANSYRDAGKPEDAIKWYDRRIAAGGWEEEVWQSAVYKAHCYKDCNKEAEFVAGLLKAYSLRPTRAEPMYDLAKFFREQSNMQPAAMACAEAVEHLPIPTDKLFLNEFVYKAGIKDELSILGFYVPGKRMKGYKVSSEQALNPYAGSSRENARINLFHYVLPLSGLCPSFKWKPINFQPPEHWVAMNPSVCMYRTALYVNVRCVNYRMDEEGRYLIRNTETGEITNDNPINTRNFLLYLGADPLTDTKPWPVSEIMPPQNLAREYPLVVGFEDVRLIPTAEDLWASACVRQIHPDGLPEQVLSKIEPIKSDKMLSLHTRVHRMLGRPRGCEKNWAPIIDQSGRFMYRVGHVVWSSGQDMVQHNTGLATDHISGSSQVIPYGEREWLAITHEARTVPGSHKRWYMHRFVLYDRSFGVRKISLPFVFHDKVIEFCAGMCWHPNGEKLVISYGYKDEEARIATVNSEEVEDLLWKIS